MRAFEAFRTFVLLGAVAAIAAGCPKPPTPKGDPDAGTTEETPDASTEVPDAGDGCIALSLGAQELRTNLFGQLVGVQYKISNPIGGELPESLFIELYDSTSPGLPPLQPGTFALGAPPNDTLASCQHCVWMPLDWDGVAPISKLFFATEGSLKLTTVEDPLPYIFAGSTSDVVLREATMDDVGVTSIVDGGQCAHLPAMTFDTSPSTGRSCLSAEDCANPLLEACSPGTGTCAPYECGDFLSCPAERPACIPQYGSITEGACYAECNPAASGTCGSGATCLQLGVDPTRGICKRIGSASLGDSCELEDTSTSCATGLLCSSTEHACTKSCSFFDANPGCQADHGCTVLGVCDPWSTGAIATLGQSCGFGASQAQGCAPENGKFRGICFGFDPSQLTCEKACLGDQGCLPEEFCAVRFTSGLGICLPDPVCGDGALGEIDELCDDGNTTSGDGCSADCKTVEYNVICPNAPMLTADGGTAGDTRTAWDGFQAGCQFGIARADIYGFDPPSRGRLRLTVDSATSHTVSIRTACADAGSELSCGGTDFTGRAELIQQVTAPAPMTVMVSAFTVLDQGPYTLQTEFLPESCGDGVVEGLEVCDDGNTVSNDGCSGDCGTIEYGYYCSQASTFSGTATGDNTNAPNVYTASCANNNLGSGPDRLFKYTAASTGTLRLELQQGNADLVLAVFDSCGAPSSMNELGCSSVYGVEKVELSVTAGQQLTVLVEGFNTDDEGPFSLTATMVP